jgi:hypothetical protein
VKRSKLGSGGYIFSCDPNTTNYAVLYWDSGVVVDALSFQEVSSGSQIAFRRTAAVYRDPSAWYHIVFAVDTTQATAADRIKLYVNGSQVTTFNSTQDPTQNSDLSVNSTSQHNIGRMANFANPFDGYLANIHHIDGQQLTPASFAETDATTGQWIPKAYSGSYGTNGFYLRFNDNSTTAALGTDSSGNGNTWTTNNFSVTAGAGNDSLIDSPTNYGTDTGVGGEVKGNYCTWNPLNNPAGVTLSNGNLDVVTIAADALGAFGTIAIPNSGKWYWEITPTVNGGSSWVGLRQDASNRLAYAGDGTKNVNGTDSSYGASYTNNDVIGVAVNTDSGQVTFYKNGVSQGAITFSTADKTAIFPYFQDNSGSVQVTASANFGQRAFAYTAPSGFKALCTQNLPASLVTKSNTVMDVALWTGNNSSPRSITGLEFNPDFVWIKERSAASYYHRLFDAVRGTSNSLYLPGTEAENTYSSGYANVSSFDSSGFTLTNTNGGNNSGVTYVGWAWDAGTSTTTINANAYSAGVPSITSQVRANASAGFSIVTWTGDGVGGRTVGHGLGVAPAFVVIKQRIAGPGTDLYNWNSYHAALGATQFIALNTTGSASTAPLFNDTAPTSTVFSLGSSTSNYQNVNNASGVTYVAYCWAPLVGYSNFGSYTGNGSADGPFVFTGFRPRFLLYKSSSLATYWVIYDAVRDTYNGVNKELYPNDSLAEGVVPRDIDFLSNGFKIRNTGSTDNTSSATYIYAAFAEMPFNYSRAR